MFVACKANTMGSRLLRRISSIGSAVSTKIIESDTKAISKTWEQGHQFLVVRWKDNSTSRFPYIYLRDLCSCNKCVDPTSLERLSSVSKNVPLNIRATSIEVSRDGKLLQIKWPDNHTTEFNACSLRVKSLLEKDERDIKRSSSSIAKEGVNVWNRDEMQDQIACFEFHKVMKDDSTLYDWLEMLHSKGIALLDGVPGYTTPTSILSLTKRVGYVKPTHYGNMFDVQAKFDANNLAYTANALPLHCDIPQSQYYPGLQFLHCLEQAPTKGGANMFVDGFHISQEFRNDEPELFKLLSMTDIPFWDIGKDDDFGEFHLKNSRPIFELDHDMKIRRFTYNNHVRDYHLDGSPEKVKQIYEGYLKLGKMMRDPKNKIDHKLDKGQMVTFNNSRVLHGRTAFIPTKSGNRHLQGAYLDWDLVYSRLRSLSRVQRRTFKW